MMQQQSVTVGTHLPPPPISIGPVAFPSEHLKQCRTCREHLPLTEFRDHNMARDGKRRHCKQCLLTERHKPKFEGKAERKKRKARESKAAWQQIHRGALARSAQRFPHKQAAVRAVGKAVKEGALVRGKVCEAKGCRSKRFIEGHHWSYSAEHHLDVLWCCATCHRRGHSRGLIETKRGIPPHKGTIPENS